MWKVTIRFDADCMDLVAGFPGDRGKTIQQYELPNFCDMRPHEDPEVEAWLCRWLDGAGDLDGGPMEVPLRAVEGLNILIEEQPEACPVLRSYFGRLLDAMAEWLEAWPHAEPARQGLVVTQHQRGTRVPSAQELELELHCVLHTISHIKPSTTPSSARIIDAMDTFRQVAYGWIFKLHSLYGLYLLSQPERIAAAQQVVDVDLSIMSWRVEHLSELLACPFFRPDEEELSHFLHLWLKDAGGGEASTKDFSKCLVTELLPEGTLHEVQEACNQKEQEQDLGQEQEPEPAPVLIHGATFNEIARAKDCPTRLLDDVELAERTSPSSLPALPPQSLCMSRNTETGRLHCWNHEVEQIPGIRRKVLVSSVAMNGTGRFRLDLRVLSGVASETAHLFELGVAAGPVHAVKLKVNGPGVQRVNPGLQEEDSDEAARTFLSFAMAQDVLLEGVRLAVEMDLGEETAKLRNTPAIGDTQVVPHGVLGTWLSSRTAVAARRCRPAGELDDALFKDQARHLREQIEEGKLVEDKLVQMVLNDNGIRCAHGLGTPDVPEAIHFYIILPTGMEIEVF